MYRRKQGQYYNRQNRARIFTDKRHDTYLSTKKYPEPTVCSKCRSVYKNGRWTWDAVPEEHFEDVCPACKRIDENYPAGIITLSGSFYSDHKEEIMKMVAHVEKEESTLHPMERIISIKSADSHSEINTTGMHLANRIANKLRDSYKGNLDVQYEGESFVRVNWVR